MDQAALQGPRVGRLRLVSAPPRWQGPVACQQEKENNDRPAARKVAKPEKPALALLRLAVNSLIGCRTDRDWNLIDGRLGASVSAARRAGGRAGGRAMVLGHHEHFNSTVADA